MPKKILLAFALVFLLASCGDGSTAPEDDSPDVVFCTADARICPDGSAVGRVPPDCEFAPCSINASTMPAKTIPLADIPVYDCESGSTAQTKCAEAGDTVAKLATKLGDIWIRLTPDATPKTVENFVGLSERGFYDGLIFHRVIPDFMIQGGDPLGNGTGGESIWGGEFEDEFSPELSNIRGAIAMANRGANTNTSQFFINQADNAFLDFKHTVFGQVVAGLRVVDEIASVERDNMDKPKEPVEMQVEIFEVAE
ncbi:MAG: peptidylprolyl isomerase [Candidatus Peribacteraceae bacterium]|nr:peptidylprolyl isomerase [Candidatus Peribacteraceae bacterium]